MKVEEGGASLTLVLVERSFVTRIRWATERWWRRGCGSGAPLVLERSAQGPSGDRRRRRRRAPPPLFFFSSQGFAILLTARDQLKVCIPIPETQRKAKPGLEDRQVAALQNRYPLEVYYDRGYTFGTSLYAVHDV